ncbi:carboxypeptidase Q-like isoform X2 [Hermetia illucens]|uniref:carboxypeptidase Q-like isoform X2 n=1 Tax=Hermetia illucens TaxID=343691 RepID=UPI0018CC6E12|nr:carboxypeptidase Q-like isoform X2 [Hermetia illucens]
MIAKMMGRNIQKVLLIFTIIADVSWSSVIDNRVDKYVYRGECHLPEALQKEIQGYQPVVNTIVDKILGGKFAGDTYNSLLEMTDKFGHRLAGSQSLEDSIDYLVDEFQKAGLENVHTEDAPVPHWVRGFESAEMISPRRAPLNLLGLGTSIGTPRGGIVAEAVAVDSFDELEAMPDSLVKGKIVIFVPAWTSYGQTVRYRSIGASVASRKGAVAALIRSITPFSIGSPHTGVQEYSSDVKKIPAACITVEDATMLLRMFRRGEKIIIRLEMEARNLEPAMSRNTIGELQGTQNPNKSVVVLSGHLDSWDVGVGAMDDAAGGFISWKAVQYLKQLGLRPKRTIRAILWTGEEFGYYGAKAYQKQHAATEKEEFNLFVESDIGTFDPLGMDFSGNEDALCIFREIMKLMTPLNATQFKTPTDGGPDISLWTNRGYPSASLLNKNERYFWFHHSAGDSMLVEDPITLDKNTALFASVAYVVANLSIDIPKTVTDELIEPELD